MRVWRISNYADLKGTGGITAGGRWHHAGRPIVYAADHPAATLLEKLVHFEFDSASDLPARYQLIEIDVPASMSVLDLDTSLLGEDWRSDQELTRQLGDAWLASLESALLAVPSAITPHSTNFLINPLHPDANQLAIASVAAYPFDVGLFKLLERR